MRARVTGAAGFIGSTLSTIGAADAVTRRVRAAR